MQKVPSMDILSHVQKLRVSSAAIHSCAWTLLESGQRAGILPLAGGYDGTEFRHKLAPKVWDLRHCPIRLLDRTARLSTPWGVSPRTVLEWMGHHPSLGDALLYDQDLCAVVMEVEEVMYLKGAFRRGESKTLRYRGMVAAQEPKEWEGVVTRCWFGRPLVQGPLPLAPPPPPPPPPAPPAPRPKKGNPLSGLFRKKRGQKKNRRSGRGQKNIGHKRPVGGPSKVGEPAAKRGEVAGAAKVSAVLGVEVLPSQPQPWFSSPVSRRTRKEYQKWVEDRISIMGSADPLAGLRQTQQPGLAQPGPGPSSWPAPSTLAAAGLVPVGPPGVGQTPASPQLRSPKIAEEPAVTVPVEPGLDLVIKQEPGLEV